MKPSEKIDPAGNLDRSDYLALRHRGSDSADAPPIPSLPSEALPPSPSSLGADKRVSVTITDTVPVRDVLIELARDAKVNLELDPRVQGGVIFLAHDQPFEQVLKRICALAGLRYTVDGTFIHIELDSPYQQTYPLDYLSLSRRSTSETSIATNVFDVDVTSGGTNGGSSHSGSSGSENNSTSKITSGSEADFWGELDKSLTQIMTSNGRKANRLATGAALGASFSMDRQAGLVTIFGDQQQQEAVASYIKKLKRKANAQVLIDARIIEVELDDSFKSGVDWKTLFKNGLNIASNFTPATATSSVFTASVNSSDFTGILNLVRGFGTTRVLSSPRLTVLNNQAAVLKVATNQVYFVTSAQFTTTTNTNGVQLTSTPVYTSTPRTVPVGLVMTVQPSIDVDHDRVTMTLRPTISRIVGNVSDPSIGLNAAQAGVLNPVQSLVPILAVREMDSVIQLRSGEVAIMGGLMQDSSINNEQGIPFLDRIPVVNWFVKSRDQQGATTELVILLRASITDAPPPDTADSDLYHRYNKDPRPLPMSDNDDQPFPPLPTNPS